MILRSDPWMIGYHQKLPPQENLIQNGAVLGLRTSLSVTLHLLEEEKIGPVLLFCPPLITPVSFSFSYWQDAHQAKIYPFCKKVKNQFIVTELQFYVQMVI